MLSFKKVDKKKENEAFARQLEAMEFLNGVMNQVRENGRQLSQLRLEVKRLQETKNDDLESAKVLLRRWHAFGNKRSTHVGSSLAHDTVNFLNEDKN